MQNDFMRACWQRTGSREGLLSSAGLMWCPQRRMAALCKPRSRLFTGICRSAVMCCQVCCPWCFVRRAGSCPWAGQSCGLKVDRWTLNCSPRADAEGTRRSPRCSCLIPMCHWRLALSCTARMSETCEQRMHHVAKCSAVCQLRWPGVAYTPGYWQRCVLSLMLLQI